MVQYHVCSLPFRSVTALVPFLCALCLFLFLFKEVPCEGSPLASSACPCDNASLCEPVTAVYRRELFGWGSARWRDYDLDRVTTIAGAHPEDSDLVCEAHRKGVRLVYWIPNHELPFEASTEGKMEYARDLASRIEEWHFDGAAFDFEDPVGWQSELSTNYTEIVRLASEEMKRRNPNRQISVAAAWSPHGIDGRYFDYLGLAEASDLLYVMAYDIQSQVFGRCIGDANSPIAFAEWGLRSFLSIGVEASKLVLGVPWYGYIYGCTEASAPVSLGQEKGEGDSGRGLQSGHRDMEAEEGKGGGGDSQLGSDADSQTASAGVAVSGQTVRTAGLTESALDSDICWMGFAPFRGVRCSDLWGRQVRTPQLIEFFFDAESEESQREGLGGMPPGGAACVSDMWLDESTRSPYFNFFIYTDSDSNNQNCTLTETKAESLQEQHGMKEGSHENSAKILARGRRGDLSFDERGEAGEQRRLQTGHGAGRRIVLAEQPRSQTCASLLGTPCALSGLMQVWFDEATSLREKFVMAKEKGIRGVGPFTWRGAVRPDNPGAPGVVDDWLSQMWESLDAFGLKETVEPDQKAEQLTEQDST